MHNNRRRFTRNTLASILALAVIALAGCAHIGEFAKKQADRDAYKIIENKQAATLGEARDFSIEDPDNPLTTGSLVGVPTYPLADDTPTTPAVTLSLADALAIAIENNRDYRTRKEGLFAQAIRLTGTRRDYETLFTGSADAAITRTDTGDDLVAGGVVAGTRGFALGASKLLSSGARVSLDFAHDYIRYFTQEPRPEAGNALSLSIVQPLLRNFGPLVTNEPLRQAERDMVYAVRDFQRYQQTFVIETARLYYNILNTRDRLRNAHSNMEQVRDNWQRMKALAEAGRRPALEADQAYQEVLQAESRLIDETARYASLLEDFRDYLGLELNVDVGPDPVELQAISDRGLLQPDMNLGEAIETALGERLDLLNVQEELEDADRQVRIARQDFLPDLEASYRYETWDSEDKDRLNLDLSDNRNVWGLNLDLPFDWRPRRNNYRIALIARQQAQREYDQTRSDIISEVRNAWRDLEKLTTDYRIQLESVRLAERRVDAASMRLDMGQLTTRDWLEAQEDLLNAQNAVTEALVDYTIQRLRFWHAIERLRIDPKGMWYE